MVTKVVMPQLGESVVEGTVNKWLVKVGQAVKEFDPLLEVSTDKVDTEVPSPASGTLLEIYVDESQTVQAGVLLAVIGEPGDAIPSGSSGGSAAAHGASTATAHTAAPVAAPTVAVPATNGKDSDTSGARISPVVARMASEHKLDISKIAGTGSGGRVTKKDVENYLANKPAVEEELPPWERPGSGDLFKPTGDFKKEPSKAPQTNMPVPTATMPAVPARAIPAEPIPQGVPGEMITLSNMRRSIADHMVRSKLQISPHVTTVMEVDMSTVMAHREANKGQFAKNGVNLTLTAYFISAMVEACQKAPLLNSQWTDEGIYLHNDINIGMAVAINDGLIVPVIKHTAEMNLMGLSRAINDLATRARNKQLKPDEITGGTITITNHGVSGSLFATPIINQPQAAIFGVGVMEKRVKVINDAIAIRPMCYISLTFDHRIADGATGDAWLMALKQRLEGWS